MHLKCLANDPPSLSSLFPPLFGKCPLLLDAVLLHGITRHSTKFATLYLIVHPSKQGGMHAGRLGCLAAMRGLHQRPVITFLLMIMPASFARLLPCLRSLSTRKEIFCMDRADIVQVYWHQDVCLGQASIPKNI